MMFRNHYNSIKFFKYSFNTMIRLHNNSKNIFTNTTLYTGGLFETSRGNHHVGKNQIPLSIRNFLVLLGLMAFPHSSFSNRFP